MCRSTTSSEGWPGCARSSTPKPTCNTRSPGKLTASLLSCESASRLIPNPTFAFVLLSRTDTDRHTAVELKYLTARWTGEYAGETFDLKNHGAQDIRAYDAVKDIGRLERFVGQRANWNGVFVAITNDPMYWRPATHGRATNADAFRIYQGITLTGTRAWGPNTGAGTMKNNRAEPIELTGAHALSWRDYSRVQGPRGEFRALVVEIPGQ